MADRDPLLDLKNEQARHYCAAQNKRAQVAVLNAEILVHDDTSSRLSGVINKMEEAAKKESDRG